MAALWKGRPLYFALWFLLFIFFMAALCNRGHYIFVLWFFLLSFFLSVFPRLIAAVAD